MPTAGPTPGNSVYQKAWDAAFPSATSPAVNAGAQTPTFNPGNIVTALNCDVWNTDELQADFDVRGFMAPYVVVVRKRDGVVGSLEFQHSPRFYFNFVPDRK